MKEQDIEQGNRDPPQQIPGVAYAQPTYYQGQPTAYAHPGQPGYPQQAYGQTYPQVQYTQTYQPQYGGYNYTLQPGFPAQAVQPQSTGAYVVPVHVPPPQVAGSQGSSVTGAPASPRPSPGHRWGEQDWEIPPEKLLTEDLDISVRHGFIRKVYGILFVQLVVTFGISLIFNLVQPAADWLYNNSWLAIILGIAMMCLVCGLVCVPGAGRKVPTNYILLMAISVCMGGLLGFATCQVSTWAFTAAAGMTTVVVLAVSLFAIQTKIDFTGCWAFGFVAILILMIFGIVAAIANNYVMDMVYASLGCIIFSFYIIFDTQRIVGGKHRKFQFSIDDYCFAALTLYLDIVNLFMYMLAIMSAADR